MFWVFRLLPFTSVAIISSLVKFIGSVTWECADRETRMAVQNEKIRFMFIPGFCCLENNSNE